jgi:DNA repair protein RadC
MAIVVVIFDTMKTMDPVTHRSSSSNNSIKAWAEDDRPREKLAYKGERSLSDAELIAILIGSGSARESAVDLSKRMLIDSGNSLTKLARLSIGELMQYKGIGQAKAISIKAALELGRRRQNARPDERSPVTSSLDAYRIISPYLQDKQTEEFWILLFNRRNHLIHLKMVSSGGVSSTVVDAKIVFHHALEKLASGIILVHNHPSGNKNPGQSDISLTKRMKEAAGLLDIDLLDHLVVTDHDYFSFRDEGML